MDRRRRAGNVADRRASHRTHPQHGHLHSLRADVQPRRQAPAHDRRAGDDAHGPVGRHGTPMGAARRTACRRRARVGLRPSGRAEGGDSFESVRRQRLDDLGHPRRGPGGLLPLPGPGSGPEVPDEPYTVPIGEAAVRTEGEDITIVGYAPQTAEIAKAVEELRRDGISAEFIDPRTLAPLEGVMETIVKSVQKTGRLLTSDEGSYSFSNCAEIIARVAEAVPGVRVKRLAFPDAPAPGAPEMIDYMKVDAAKIAAAARKMVAA